MTERKMATLYVFLLMAWWGGWLALDVWRIEHLLTDADKWAGFRRDILWCAGSAVVSVIFFMATPEKNTPFTYCWVYWLRQWASRPCSSSVMLLFTGDLICRCYRWRFRWFR